MKKVTTIKIYYKTKERLDKLKEYPRESYEEVLRKILFILNLSKKNPENASRLLKRLDVIVRRKSKGYSDVYHDEEKTEVDEDNEESIVEKKVVKKD